MKTLYLLRHAKAESGGAALQDADRKLAPRGREACERIGQYMQEKGYVPDAVLCSPAARTQETYALVAESHGKLCAPQLEKKLYLATAEAMLSLIHLADDAAESLMVIGHNPGMHHLAALLASSAESPLRLELELKYPTGALTVLAFHTKHWQSIAPDTGEIRDFVLPDAL